MRLARPFVRLSVPYGLLTQLENLSTPHVEFAAFEISMVLSLG